MATAGILQRLVFLAGMGQISLAVASLAIPWLLGWREETRRLRPLTQQVFWTYAGYICLSNLSFGLLSAFAPGALTDGSTLALAVTAFVGGWWGVRLLLQLAVLDRTAAPAGLAYRLADAALTGLFVFLTAVYGFATAANLREVLT